MGLEQLLQPSRDLGTLVCEALGINTDLTRRVILDINASARELVCVYVEMYGSKSLLNIDWAEGLKGAVIKQANGD
jgi:hypothetical protein